MGVIISRSQKKCCGSVITNAAITPKALRIYSREVTRLTSCGLFASFAPLKGQGLSPWLYSVETVIISFIHHGRMNHYFCFILVVDIPHGGTSNALVFGFMASPVGSHSSATFTDYVWITDASSATIAAAVRFSNDTTSLMTSTFFAPRHSQRWRRPAKICIICNRCVWIECAWNLLTQKNVFERSISIKTKETLQRGDVFIWPQHSYFYVFLHVTMVMFDVVYIFILSPTMIAVINNKWIDGRCVL